MSYSHIYLVYARHSSKILTRVLTCKCQLDDFKNVELSLLLVFEEREEVHTRTEGLQKHDGTPCPWPTIQDLVCHSLNTV